MPARRPKIVGLLGGISLLLAGCASWLASVPAWADAQRAPGFAVVSARTYLADEVYRLNAQLRLRLSHAVLEALQNDVPITIELEIQVVRPRWWLWPATVASLHQRYRIRYHALSRQYLVENLNTGVRRIYPTHELVLEALSSVRDLPILDRKLLTAGGDYYARVRALLDIDALPLPLRPLAYISSEWRLGSEWYTCPLQKS